MRVTIICPMSRAGESVALGAEATAGDGEGVAAARGAGGAASPP